MHFSVIKLINSTLAPGPDDTGLYTAASLVKMPVTWACELGEPKSLKSRELCAALIGWRLSSTLASSAHQPRAPRSHVHFPTFLVGLYWVKYLSVSFLLIL